MISEWIWKARAYLKATKPEALSEATRDATCGERLALEYNERTQFTRRTKTGK